MAWRILVVDDEIEMRTLVCALLTNEGLEAHGVADGVATMAALAARPPDLVILDVGLTGEDGIDLGRRIRETSSVPIVFLTGHAQHLVELSAFAVGAEDFIAKPFHPQILVARIRAVLARNFPQGAQAVSGAPVEIDLAARTVKVNDGWVHLTRTEFDILALLYERGKNVVTREQIAEAVWGASYGATLIDGHMSRLRNKILQEGGPRLGIAVRGVGYRLGPG